MSVARRRSSARRSRTGRSYSSPAYVHIPPMQPISRIRAAAARNEQDHSREFRLEQDALSNYDRHEMSDAGDSIHIQELELSVRIGVPDDERAKPQRLTVSITIWPSNAFDELKDDLTKTVNYSAVACEVQQFVSSRTDKLIETLADAIASHILQKFSVQRVRIELRKFVLPDAK